MNRKTPSSAPNEAHGSVVVEELRVSAMTAIDSASGFEATGRNPPVRPPQDPRRFAQPDLAAGTRVGEYEVERKVGEGGMGAVYAAVHPVLGKRVAIKVIGNEVSSDQSAIARFRREARVVAQLASPHIVDVFGFGELDDGRAYFVMEYLSGESLRDRIARGRVPLDEALELLEQTARGLEAAHEAGIVHRDLKPENIFIERSRNLAPVVKLLDFGIVKLAKHDEDIAKTQAGVLIGTPMYAAPEQIRSAGEVDARADVYALGGVAFELVLGRVPFVRSTVVELVAAHLECAPPQPRTLWPEIPVALDALLFAMLAKEPSKRPTLGHVQETLETLRRSAFANPSFAPMLAAPAPVTGSPRGLQGSSSRRSRLVALIAVLTLAIVAVATLIGPHGRSPVSKESAVVVPPAGMSVSPIATSSVPVVKPAATANAAPPAKPDARPRTQLTRTPVSPSVPPTATGSAQTSGEVVPPRPGDGELDISSKPPCEVAIDGRPLGHRTPLTGFRMESGIHRVTLTNDQYGIAETVSVQVLAGEPVRVVKDYSARIRPVDPNGTIDPFAGGGH